MERTLAEAVENTSGSLRSDALKERVRSASGRQLIFALIVAGLFTAIVSGFIFVLSTIVVFEKEAEKRELRSVSRVFENSKATILREIERFAASNAAYQNIDTRYSLPWVESRFGQEMAADYGHDLIFLVGRDGYPVYEKNNGKVETTAVPRFLIKGDVAALMRQVRTNYVVGLDRNNDGNTIFAGKNEDVSGLTTVKLGNHVGLVAVHAIIPDPGGIPMKAVAPYVLVAIHIMDDAYLKDLLEALSLDDISVAAEIPTGKIGVPISDTSEETLAYLVWRPAADASQTVLAWAPLLSAALLVILLLTMIALRQNYVATLALKRREQEAIQASRLDTLTGLARRDLFYEQASKTLEAQGDAKVWSAVVYLDMDFLKQTNDTYGHVIGDQLIINLTETVKSTCDKHDVFGRIGGDEFLLLMPGRASEAELLQDVAGLCVAINHEIVIDDLQVKVSCSMGIAMFPEHGETLPQLVRSADIALQRCKADGRGNYRMYDVAMDEALHEKRRIQEGLKRALERQEFVAFYQPIIAASSGRVAFAEALIRWKHPERGLLGPGAFLPVAEEDGSINALGAWILEQAISDASKWPETGVTVNVCASQLLEAGFVQRVADLIREYGLPPERLVLEITESVMMDRSGCIRQVFANLSDLGIAVAIDDFGTGFSSLSYLHEYRFQKMKIDRSFVSRIETDVEAGTIIRTMIGLAKVLGMTVVAEGVETEAQFKFLKRAQCDFLQGFYFDKPAPLEQVQQKLLLSA
ncbi:EAL domain-containing protein [Roseibium sp.]|uniref:bifunctional diguanylate cyclase/phosphodiesterase n=1 Tax=Roseibium sp. TaxID=1936156 RepID=UPI003A96DADF